MTTIDPITELSDTLYDALYAITPYAEPHFADETEGLKNAVRAVLDEAQQQAEKQRDGVLRIVADWYASSEGRDVLIEDLAAAGHQLPEATP